MNDAHPARMELGEWFMKVLDELDEKHVDDAAAIESLKCRRVIALADWRIASGYGLGGRGTGPSAPQ